MFPNLWLGSSLVDDVFVDEKKVDMLVPLNDADGDIWEGGWRGELYYVPIRDYYDLPADVALRTAKHIVQRLEEGKKVGIYCMGGHGRTGYIAAIVIGLLLPDVDPIEYVRKEHCDKAIESREQIESIAHVLKRPELKEHKPAKAVAVVGYQGNWNHWDKEDSYGYGSGVKTIQSYAEQDIKTLQDTCFMCEFYLPETGRCQILGAELSIDDKFVGCECYEPFHKGH